MIRQTYSRLAVVKCQQSLYLLVGQGRYRDPTSSTQKILIKPPHRPPPPISFEGTIVFPAPELVYTDIYMVGVP